MKDGALDEIARPPSTAFLGMSRRAFDGKIDVHRFKNSFKLRTEGKRLQKEHTSAGKAQNGHVSAAKSKELSNIVDEPLGGDSDEGPASPLEPSALPPLPPAMAGSPDELPSHSNAAEAYAQDGSPRAQSISFDLAAPPPNKPLSTVEGLSEQLFSDEHLHVILRDPSFFLKFTAFLNRYKIRTMPTLVRYLETQKAIKAVEYANAIAFGIPPVSGDHASSIPCAAATSDARFEGRSKRAFENLVTEALPAFITHTLVQVVTDCMVKEITGTLPPIMRDLVGNLAEVFCLTDPSIDDNPIVYASEEFYRTTQYGRDYVIGRNCRFLQGPKTNRASIARIGSAIQSGQETCETFLNYRRDGSPFVNLLLCAPLFDNRGQVRYFIGAQIDVSGLVEDGKGLESFKQLLDETKQREQESTLDCSEQSHENVSKAPLKLIEELGQMLSLEESSAIQSGSRSNSLRDETSTVGSHAYSRSGTASRMPRRVLDDGSRHENEQSAWGLSSMGGLSGRLPGVYQNYLLVRPSPSLRIIFVSASLRIPGLLQSHFLSRIGGPSHVRNGLADAFDSGTAVTAKVNWLSSPNTEGDDDDGEMGGVVDKSKRKIRWISCTPLLGSDDRVGVWMVIMVDNHTSAMGFPPSHEREQGFGMESIPSPPLTSKYDPIYDTIRDDGSNPGSEKRLGRNFSRVQGVQGHVERGAGMGMNGRSGSELARQRSRQRKTKENGGHDHEERMNETRVF